ncbi:lytic transglycosylase domain-containing protein [[Mycobacterium] wendilense]|uniref:Lytic murein transglycosylase n=1 Tax=[Mycobacterium] wendilense TaxID=3064284 RepID=A0ABM9MAX8_9MYCO|nr:lytic murein transglycosylase [Mycolicibacterium sp. MU0050]CAJ1580731.1 lytic murein transglycosylase [Mycolicibacterium sp. MU0050]
MSSARNRVSSAARSPALGVAVITPLVLAAAVGASGPVPAPAPTALQNTDVTPMVAVAPTPVDTSGPTVVAVARPVTSFNIASAAMSAPPPAAVVTAPGALRIPSIALSAYRNAESMLNRAQPSCGVSWNLLAGIGRIESGHANGGATDTRGNPVKPIYGPALDGTLPGNEIIVQSVQAGRVTYARAMGPMQFLPGTWSRYASDGDGDGEADPQNIYDATLAAARYLCSGNMNLRDQDQVLTAILRYNNSMAYARNVLGWAAAYATGVAPVDLPPINGPIPAVTVAHVNAFQGLGPDIPGTAQGLPSTDPLARNPMLAQTDVANQLPVPPGPEALPGTPGSAPCQVFCISEKRTPAPASTPPAPAPFSPPWMAPAPPAPGAPAPAPAPGTPPWMAPAPPAPGLPAPAPAPAAPLGPAPGPAA